MSTTTDLEKDIDKPPTQSEVDTALNVLFRAGFFGVENIPFKGRYYPYRYSDKWMSAQNWNNRRKRKAAGGGPNPQCRQCNGTGKYYGYFGHDDPGSGICPCVV